MSLIGKLRSAQLRVLNDLNVASPCSADWNQMEGDEKVRYCGDCRLHVFNLSAMDLEEAAEVVSQHAEGLCVRFFRRHDGTVLTRDCPIGVERKRLRRRLEIRRAACGFVAGAGLALCVRTVWVTAKPSATTLAMGNAQIVNQRSPMRKAPVPEPVEVLGNWGQRLDPRDLTQEYDQHRASGAPLPVIIDP